MIRVIPTDLHRAADFGQLLGESPTAGPRTWHNEYLFEYSGGETLAITATNNRLVLRTHLTVVGRASPWRAAVEVRRFNYFQHIDGGLVEIGPQGTGRLLIRDGTLRMPFPARLLRADEAGPWPLATGEVAGGADAHELASYLRLLPTDGERPPSHVLSWYADGVMAAFERGVWFRVVGPVLPFEWNLTLRDAKRVLAWLDVTLKPPKGVRRKKREPREPRPVTAGHLTAADGGRFVRLADAARGNELIVPVASRSCPRYPVDRASTAHALVRVAVSRRELLRLARLAQGLRNAHHLRCAILLRDDEPRLAATIGAPDDPDFRAEVPLTDLTPGAPPAETHVLALPPRRLGYVAQRMRADEVCLCYRPSVNLLGVSPHTGATGGPVAEWFIDARPPSGEAQQVGPALPPAEPRGP